jgi:hypothetical protein
MQTMTPEPGRRRTPRLERNPKKEDDVRAEQTVSEMVVESMARQAEALSERTGQTFEGSFAEVLKTPAGRKLTELADGSHRHEKAAEWQAGLLADREARRPAYLRDGKGAECCCSWLGRDAERVEGGDGREEYYVFLGERFASLESCPGFNRRGRTEAATQRRPE